MVASDRTRDVSPLSALTSELNKERNRTQALNSELSRKSRSKRQPTESTRKHAAPAQTADGPGLEKALSQYLCDRLSKLACEGTYPRLALKASERSLGQCSPRVLELAQELFSEAERELAGTATTSIALSTPEEALQVQRVPEVAASSNEVELQAALRDMAMRLEQNDRGEAEQQTSDNEATMTMMQDALVHLAEENVALQERLATLEHIALAAALGPMDELTLHGTPPMSPAQSPSQKGLELITPPSPMTASRLNFGIGHSETPDAPASKVDRETPDKMGRLDLKSETTGRRSGSRRSSTGSASSLDRYVDEATAQVCGLLEEGREMPLGRKKRLF